MFMQRIEDIECNRCKGTYQNTDRGTMSVMINHCFLSICPKCTREVAALMGFTPENITKELGLIKQAETENNRMYRLEHGDVCRGCEKKFAHDEPRVRESNASNVESWHITCYDAKA